MGASTSSPPPRPLSPSSLALLALACAAVWTGYPRTVSGTAPPGGSRTSSSPRSGRGEGETNTCAEQACATPFAFYHPAYPRLREEADALFEARYDGDRMFRLDSDAVVEAWDGTQRTVDQHFDWMKRHIEAQARDDATGFHRQGEKDGVVYEMHEEFTQKAGGVGYFRLRAEISLDPATFVALMADPHLLFEMDPTIRLMDFARSPQYAAKRGRRKVWLAYFRQAPGGLLPDLDGIDLSGWEAWDDGSGAITQASMGLPKLLPEYRGKITDWYPPAFRSWDMHWGYTLVPLPPGSDGEPRSQLTLICQHDLRNWMVPNFLANRMVGDVLADYVRTAERVGKQLVADGKDADLRERHGF